VANNKVERDKYIQNNPHYLARTVPRKVYRGKFQANSFGVLEIIPNCPKCNALHSFVVVSRVQNRDPKEKGSFAPAIAEQRQCTKCNFSSAKNRKEKGTPPTLDQIEYANHLIRETYLSCKRRFLKRYPKGKIEASMVDSWKRKAKKVALGYLVEVTGGYAIKDLYPEIFG
jgi:hypothetical protein